MVSPSRICVTRAVRDCVGEGETAGVANLSIMTFPPVGHEADRM
jgi:hypothetical protein